MKKLAQKALDYLVEHAYEIEDDYDYDDNLIINYIPIKGIEKRVGPLQRLIDSYPEWISFTADEDGVLNCPLPEVGEEVLISDGDLIIIDTFAYDGECYYLDSSNWDLIGLAWMRLPKPHGKLRDLAIKVDQFFKDSDPYEYMDCIDDCEESVENILLSLENGETEYIIDYIEGFIAEGGLVDDIVDAIELLNEVKSL